MIAHISHGSCPMCAIPKSVPMGHSTFRPLHYSRDQHAYLQLLNETNIDVLHIFGVQPVYNQCWQNPLCNVSRLWQSDILHQLLLGIVKDLFHQLLKYLRARNVQDQFDNRFTLVPQNSGLQQFSKPYNFVKTSSGWGEEIWEIVRPVAMNYTPIVDRSKDVGNIAAETASGELAMGAVQPLCVFSLLVSQQWSIPHSTIWWTEGILQDKTYIWTTENVEVCEGQSVSTVGKRILSHTGTNEW